MDKSMKIISYGLGNVLDTGIIKPVMNRNFKPHGQSGIWGSPVESEFGWREFCLRENYGDLNTSFKFDIMGNVLKIDSKNDLKS